ncbi:slit homolog 2 protein-like [Mytilus californianus]|uniref:slit homolog 2 protein-like n=1 Tax=Mytilus californianus TaxID=6549 RepID=UPI0022457098|nr:slit homolog 2 protein-like [Mytilus californianus]
MPKLNILTLGRNSILQIEINAFGDLQDLLLLSLESNSLICDCRIRSFHLWLLQQTHTNAHGAVCSNLNGLIIKDISNVEECKETTTGSESLSITSKRPETTQPVALTTMNNIVDQKTTPATTEILDNELTTVTMSFMQLTKEQKMTPATTEIMDIEQTTDAKSSKQNIDNQSVITIPILLGIIACTVSVMAFITIIIYVVIKTRCKNKQEGTVGFDHAITPNRYFNEYDIPQEMI